RAMPVLFAGREPDHVARSNLLDRAAPALRAAGTGGDDQRLTERMRMPRRPRAGLEDDARADGAPGIGGLEHRIEAHRAREVLGRSFTGRLRPRPLDLHRIARSLRAQRVEFARSATA